MKEGRCAPLANALRLCGKKGEDHLENQVLPGLSTDHFLGIVDVFL